jgi:hypothetical protein
LAGRIQEWGKWRNRKLAIQIINVRVLHRGAHALGTADADTAHIFFILQLCRPARKCGSLNHRSHFGSRYKLGCCCHAGLSGFGLAHRHQSKPSPATRKQYLRLHGNWRGLDSGTGVPQAACLLTTSTSMWVRQAARLLFTCRKVVCQYQACHKIHRLP